MLDASQRHRDGNCDAESKGHGFYRPFKLVSDQDIMNFLDVNEIPSEIDDVRYLRCNTSHFSNQPLIQVPSLRQRPRASGQGPIPALSVRPTRHSPVFRISPHVLLPNRNPVLPLLPPAPISDASQVFCVHVHNSRRGHRPLRQHNRRAAMAPLFVSLRCGAFLPAVRCSQPLRKRKQRGRVPPLLVPAAVGRRGGKVPRLHYLHILLQATEQRRGFLFYMLQHIQI